MNAKPYGHAAILIRRPYGKPDNEQIQIHRKGSRKTIERAARLVSGFISLESIDVYETHEQFVRVFGEGSERGSRR